MAKERMLTVLVPIKDEDAITVTALPPVSVENINNIYKHEGVYKRLWLNPSTNQYEYHVVVDREFPYLGKPLEIFDFTYDATRMGSAPTISAQGVMWFADKDEDNNDVTLEDLWLARNNDCHVTFNGENYYLKQVPTSSKSNEDARYRYDIDFVSERVVLEQVYIYDVVQPFVTERPISESSVFSFYGDINELANRINASLLRSGLSELVMREGISSILPMLTYEEWNSIGLGTYSGDINRTRKINPDTQSEEPYIYFYPYYRGDYSSYLRNEIYLYENGEFVIKGYQIKIGKDKTGQLTSSEEKLVSFDNNTIHEALQQVHDIYKLQYFVYRETDADDVFTGNTVIMIADCEHDFADMNQSGTDYVRDDEGIPTTEHPFDYGVDNALLSKEKTNTTDKIVTRITGVGSDENIPWHYPNPTADGWIKPIYKQNGIESDEIVVGYPEQEGTTVPENVSYEKYLKNRIGDEFNFGKAIIVKHNRDYVESASGFNTTGTGIMLRYLLSKGITSATNPKLLIGLRIADGSNVGRIQAYLYDLTSGTQADSYDSNATYYSPTEFQRAMISGNEDVIVGLTQGHKYEFYIFITRSGLRWPNAKKFNFSGYYYPKANITTGSVIAQIPEDFYSESGLVAAAGGVNQVLWGGYTVDGTAETLVTPITRVKGKQFKDNASGDIFYCRDDRKGIISNGLYQEVFTRNPQMGWVEWVETFLSLNLSVFNTDGWYKNGKKIELSDFSLSLPQSVTSTILDSIEFKRNKWVTPQPSLMPEVYIKTDGERRFYNAVNYPLPSGTPDPMIGEETSESGIINPIYYKENTTTHFDFENEYIQSRPHEHIEKFDDVKPTIKGQTNTITVDGVDRTFRIDVVEEFGYDELDNDEIWESNDGGNASGEYKHPFFFAKLRPLGFNIFDLALQEDMVLSMTTGHCGACNFKIGVDENTKKNPVQIWEHDVFVKNEDGTYSETQYKQGDLRRHVDTSRLYYYINEEYVQVGDSLEIREGFLVRNQINSRQAVFERSTYSYNAVANGEVGSLRQEPKNHFVGDVKVSGRFIDSQQDTSENYVWIALYKDTDTYGTIMPSAKPDYSDGNYSYYIEPKGHLYRNRATGESVELDDDAADKFVFVNIKLPQVYIHYAERELAKKIVRYMYDNNYQKFNFSIKFSRIFLAQNIDIEKNLNENSVMYVSFNNRTYRQYVKHYTYRMSHDAALPEITVDMNEELSVSRTLSERQSTYNQQHDVSINRRIRRYVSNSERNVMRTTVSRNDDVLMSGNILSRDGKTSILEMQTAGSITENNLSETMVNFDVFSNRGREFAEQCNEFNTSVAETINAMRITVEERLIPLTTHDSDSDCGFETNHYDINLQNPKGFYFWYDYDGLKKAIPDECPANATNGMNNIEWNVYQID